MHANALAKALLPMLTALCLHMMWPSAAELSDNSELGVLIVAGAYLQKRTMATVLHMSQPGM